MSFASRMENEAFPQTFITIEGEKGSLQLGKNYDIRITTDEGTSSILAAPRSYSWMDPAYAVVHSSIVDCNRDILLALQGKGQAETTAEDNFRTVKLVWAAYRSMETNAAINMQQFSEEYSLSSVQWTSR